MKQHINNTTVQRAYYIGVKNKLTHLIMKDYEPIEKYHNSSISDYYDSDDEVEYTKQ